MDTNTLSFHTPYTRGHQPFWQRATSRYRVTRGTVCLIQTYWVNTWLYRQARYIHVPRAPCCLPLPKTNQRNDSRHMANSYIKTQSIKYMLLCICVYIYIRVKRNPQLRQYTRTETQERRNVSLKQCLLLMTSLSSRVYATAFTQTTRQPSPSFYDRDKYFKCVTLAMRYFQGCN